MNDRNKISINPIFLSLLMMLWFNSCDINIPTKECSFPSWLVTGQYIEDTTQDFPSYWYFEKDGISLSYQDPSYHYIRVSKYISFLPETTSLSINGDKFTFTDDGYTVTITRIDQNTISVDFSQLQSLGGGIYKKTAY